MITIHIFLPTKTTVPCTGALFGYLLLTNFKGDITKRVGRVCKEQYQSIERSLAIVSKVVQSSQFDVNFDLNFDFS